MQEYWESYVKPIEGKKAMVAFNATVADTLPNYEYMYVGFVKIKLKNPKEDGLVQMKKRMMLVLLKTDLRWSLCDGVVVSI